MNAKAILRANGAASLKQIKFPCYLKESKREIDALNLSTRSYSALRRAKIDTIEQLTRKAKEVSNLRGVGVKSQNEILEKLFIFQYGAIPQSKRRELIEQVIALSSGRKEDVDGS